MKNRILQTTMTILFLAIIGAIGWIVFKYFTRETLIALIAGALPSLIFWRTQIRKERQDHRNWVLRNKEAFLIEFIDSLSQRLNNTDKSATKQEKELLKTLDYLRPALIAWGSPSIIEAWNNLGRIKESNSTEGIKQGEKLLRTIRKELGHDDSNLEKGEVMAFFIKGDEKDSVIKACKDLKL